jgi:hypothetical protein
LNINTTYFEIPVNIKVFANNKIAYATTGVTIGIPLEANYVNNRTEEKNDFKEGLAKLMLSANFGVGAQFRIGKPLLFFELRYSQSLTNMNKEEIESIKKIKSNSLQLFAGIKFTL